MSELETDNATWKRNIPFPQVPPQLVMNFRGHRFTPMEFYFSTIWLRPDHWNSGLYINGDMVAFMYGTFDPLEKDLFVKRVVADPRIQSYRNTLVQMILDEVEAIAKENGAQYGWMVTSRADAMYRKGGGRGAIRRDKIVLENEFKQG